MTFKPQIIMLNATGKSPTRLLGLWVIQRWQFMCVLLCLGGGFLPCLHAGETAAYELATSAQVDSSGIFLRQLVKSGQPLPSVRLCDAPEFGSTTNLTAAQVGDLLAIVAPDLATTNWTGANTVEISRRTHNLTEMNATALLTATLQKNYVKDKGELELDFTQPWTA